MNSQTLELLTVAFSMILSGIISGFAIAKIKDAHTFRFDLGMYATAVVGKLAHVLQRAYFQIGAVRYIHGPEFLTDASEQFVIAWNGDETRIGRNVRHSYYAVGNIRRNVNRYSVSAAMCNILISVQNMLTDETGAILIGDGALYNAGRVMVRNVGTHIRAQLDILPNLQFFGLMHYVGNLAKNIKAVDAGFRARRWMHLNGREFKFDTRLIKSHRNDTNAEIAFQLEKVNKSNYNFLVHIDDDQTVTLEARFNADIEWTKEQIQIVVFALAMRATNYKARSPYMDHSEADNTAMLYDAKALRDAAHKRSPFDTCCTRSNNAAYKSTLPRIMGTIGGQWGRLVKTLCCVDEMTKDHAKGKDAQYCEHSADRLLYNAVRQERNEYLNVTGKACKIPRLFALDRYEQNDYEIKRAELRKMYQAKIDS